MYLGKLPIEEVAQDGKLAEVGKFYQTDAMATLELDERTVLDRGLERLSELLGSGFEIGPLRAGMSGSAAPDAVYTVRAKSPGASYAQVVIEAKASLTPAAAKEILLPQIRLLSQLYGDAAVLVIAPWLSPRTREILSALHISYLDLTGNIDFRLPTGVLIKTEGAQHDPAPSEPKRRSRGLAGAAAGVVTRLLVDYSPPYRQKDLATVGRVSPGYISRVLRTLDDEALITREGPYITDVSWADLLRARAANYDLMKANHVVPMVARKGPEATYRSLIAQGTEADIVITGTYAAREVAPLTVGGALMIYVRPGLGTIDQLTDELSLMPAVGGGANVVLLKPPNRNPFDRCRSFGATQHVAMSHLAIDCLSGPGRMPAEGEAVISHMAETEEADRWHKRPGELAREAAALS